jgi:hypothetical protein
MLYTLSKIENISDLTKKDSKAIDSAISSALLSNFESSHRMGSYLLLKGKWIPWA